MIILMLEQMRMIYISHTWASDTLQHSFTTLKRGNQLFLSHDIPPIHDQLYLHSLHHPPLNIAAHLFWSMIYYTTFPSDYTI